jgi:hypothetical protein
MCCPMVRCLYEEGLLSLTYYQLSLELEQILFSLSTTQKTMLCAVLVWCFIYFAMDY